MTASSRRPVGTEAPAGPGGADPPGPIFVAGRQHSGNTVTTMIFGRVPGCFSVNVEGRFFEDRTQVRRAGDAAARCRKVVELLRLEDEQLARETQDALDRWHGGHPGAGDVDLYREAMRFATCRTGNRWWVRRATSYIFCAEEVLRSLPEARMIYLLRNPHDVWASLKRRSSTTDPAGWVVGWNRGLKMAERLQDRHPERFLIVRYEDIARQPVETFRGVFEFAGVPFDPAYLDVPHVNRSEAIQTRTSATRGINPSRVHYYRDVLSPHEIAAVDMVAARDLLNRWYPDLAHRVGRHPAAARVRALGLLAASPARFVLHELRQFRTHDPRWRIRRLLRRLHLAIR